MLSCIRRPGVTGTLGPDTLMLVSLAMWEKIANPCYQPVEFEIWVMLFYKFIHSRLEIHPTKAP